MKSKILSLAIIIAITVIALYCVLSGPETIILHWNIGGEAESYGSKYLILALPVISFIVFLLIVNQEKHPYDTSLMSEKSRRNRNPKGSSRYNANPVVGYIVSYSMFCPNNFYVIISTILSYYYCYYSLYV